MTEKIEKESTVTFKTWGFIALIAVIFGFFFLTALGHESRLTRVETTIEVTIGNMAKSLDNLAAKIDRHVEDRK